MIEINITRDSVHISDDVNAPHNKKVTLEKLTVKELYNEIKKMDYLPRFSGNETWAIMGFTPISIIVHQMSELRPLMNSDMLLEIELKKTNNKLHLCCFGGIESKKVLEVLSEFTNVNRII